MSLDQYGITMIYPTTTGGRVWNSKWSQQVSTELFNQYVQMILIQKFSITEMHIIHFMDKMIQEMVIIH